MSRTFCQVSRLSWDDIDELTKVVQLGDMVLSGKCDRQSFRNKEASTGLVEAFTGPGRISALTQTGKLIYITREE